MMNYEILMPPPEVFLNQARTPQDQVMPTPVVVPVLEKTILPETGGIYVKYYDIKALKKGFPYREAIAAVNEVKRITMFFTSFASKAMVLPALGFLLLPFSKKLKIMEKAMFNYCRIADDVLSPHHLKTQYYADCPKELWKLTYGLLTGIGISDVTASRMGRTICTLIEYDDAYHFRVQDLFSTTTKEKLLLNPRIEITKLIQTLRQREKALDDYAVGDKLVSVGKIVSFLMLLPRFRKAFRKALKDVDFSKLQLTEDDKYWCLLRSDYKFFGNSIEERTKIYEEIHKDKFPTLVKTSIQYN